MAACLATVRTGRASAYPATIEAMRAAHETETRVRDTYMEFGRRAQQEGYRGIAYLCVAFAASEKVHAGNFGKMLVRLGAQPEPITRPAIVVGTTRDNLIRAAEGELHSIEDFYPRLLKQLEPEGNEDAMTLVRYAWASEQQHLGKIRQIRRWTGAFFETVARTIDEKTGQYFVCQACGSTVNARPAERCAVCKQPPTQYRAIEPPA